MKGLTQKQKNIIEFINEFMTAQEMAPTIYEIAEHFLRVHEFVDEFDDVFLFLGQTFHG